MDLSQRASGDSAPLTRSLAPARDKLTRYVGLLPGLLLAYGLYFGHLGTPSGDAATLSMVYPVAAASTTPSRLAFSAPELAEVAAYHRMADACSSGRKAFPVQGCNWWAILERALVQEKSILPRPADFSERARALLAQTADLRAPHATDGGSPRAAPRPTDTEQAAALAKLEAERDELLAVVRANVQEARPFLRQELAINHFKALGLVLVLLLARGWLGAVLLWPFRAGSRLLRAVHRGV